MGGTRMQKNLFFFVVRVALAACGSSAFAYNWSTNPGNGTPENPYQISNTEQLAAIGSDDVLLSRHFVLTADIDLVGTTYSSPLIAPDMDIVTPGFQGSAFTGTFDGRNHPVSNLTIVPLSGRETIGLFGKLDKAAILNLTLSDVSIQAPQSNYVAALAGQMSSATITRCYVDGAIVGRNNVAGLIANFNGGDLLDNSFTGTVVGSAGSFRVGGLVGMGNSGQLRRCFATGSLTVGNTSYDIGGLIGYINGVTIYSCAADMDIYCGDNASQVGGLIGTFDFFSDLENCHSLGSINIAGLANNIGGLIGNIGSLPLDVKNSYSACAIVGSSGSDIGGLIGDANTLTPTHCYFLAQADGGGPNNGVGSVLTATQMKIKASFVGFDFLGLTGDGLSDHWRLCTDGARRPVLSWLYAENGDFACPNGTNLDDVLALAAHWLEMSEQTAFNEACDADGSGKVDLADAAILSQNWLAETTDFDLDTVITFSMHWLSTSATWEQGDYTGDGKVDLADWSILSANYHSW